MKKRIWVIMFLCLFMLGMKRGSYSRLNNPASNLIRSLYQTKPWKTVPLEVLNDIYIKHIYSMIEFSMPYYRYVYNQKDCIICSYYLSDKGDIIWLKDNEHDSISKEFYLATYAPNLPKRVKEKRKKLKFVGYNNTKRILFTMWGTKNLVGTLWKVDGDTLVSLGSFNGADLELKKSDEVSMCIQFPETVQKIKEISFPIQRQ